MSVLVSVCAYDAENRLTGMTNGMTSSYVYDGDGNRVKKTISGVTRVFIGNHYEIDSGVVKKYYYAGATRVAENRGGTLYYLLTDQLGSTRVTTSDTGVQTAEMKWAQILLVTSEKFTSVMSISRANFCQ